MLKLGLTSRGLKLLPNLLWSMFFISLFSEPALSQITVLSQVPNRVDNIRSDAQPLLPFAPSGDSVADNFVLTSETQIKQIKVWGIYAYGDNAPAADNFSVIFHSDSGGLPGPVLSSQHNVPVTRQLTGGASGGFTEYVYTLRLKPILLGRGTYWVEIYDDTPGNADDFFWEFGVVDRLNGIPGAADAFAAPGNDWHVLDVDSDRRDLAIEMTGTPLGVIPDLTEWGMIIMSILFGGSGVYLLMRRRTV